MTEYSKVADKEPQLFFLMRSILGVRELVTALFAKFISRDSLLMGRNKFRH
jgi:hypothetical protein